MSRRIIGLTVVLSASLSVPLAAQPVDFQVAGYVKDLAARATSTFGGESYGLNTARARLQFSAEKGSSLSADVWLDTELLSGDYINSSDFEFTRGFAFDEFADLDWTIRDTHKFRLEQRLYRVTITATSGAARAVVGRQRIAWGSGFVWTPTDVLNPVSPVALERDEKAGVDAAYIDYAVGPLTRFEAAFAPSRDAARTSMAGRVSSHVGEFDVAAMGGRIRDSWIIGGDFAGYLGDAGFRGEAALTHTDDRDFVRAVINADYNFPGDYYTFVELHYNGAGSGNKGDYDITQILSGQTLNLARYYVAASVAKTLSPLVSATFYGIQNADDGSGLAGPAVTWSAKENLEISASAYVFYGASDSEFGQAGNVYFVIVQYFF